MTDEGNKDTTPEDSQPDPETRDLRDEVGGGPIETLNDLPDHLREEIEKNQRRAVTEAKEKWSADNSQVESPDNRQGNKSRKRDLNPEDTPLTRGELKALLREEQISRERDQRAEKLMVDTLREVGMDLHGERFQKLNDTYYKGIDDGLWDKSVLATKAGIRSLMMHAGVAQPEAESNARASYSGEPTDSLNLGGDKYLKEELKGQSVHDAEAREHVTNALRQEGVFTER